MVAAQPISLFRGRSSFEWWAKRQKNSEVIEHFVQQQRLKVLGNRQSSSTK